MDVKSITWVEMPEILNAELIAVYLGISYAKALHTIKYSGIPHKKIGNTYRVTKQQFEYWLNNE